MNPCWQPKNGGQFRVFTRKGDQVGRSHKQLLVGIKVDRGEEDDEKGKEVGI